MSTGSDLPRREIAVVGGHGKTGKAVAAVLEGRGSAVHSLGRAELAMPGALDGCDVVYLIAPNMYADEPAFVEQMLTAAVVAGASKIVYHSVATSYAPAMPHHLGKAISEDLIRRGPLSWTILQPSPYVQNFLPSLRAAEPALRMPYDVTKPFNFVDLVDVAEAAANVLLDSRHDGATYELGGPDRMNVGDVARIAGDLLGRQVPVGRIDPDEWSTNQGVELEPRVRAWLLAMFDYYDHYGLPCGSVPLEALLGRRPTSVRSALQRDLEIASSQ